MPAVQITCPQTGATNFFRDIPIEETTRVGRQLLKEAVSKGHRNPKVKIIVENIGVWLVLTKKDIAPKITEAQTLTPAEEALLKRVVAHYEAYGVENTDFHNLMDREDNTKAIRGTLSSLTRKQVLNRNDCPDCFNPIYPSNSFKATCEKYGIAYTEKTRAYI